jgi:NAD(P)-dependent dehydrogenase (short-subunit alcohol dehydrogenase family)
LDASDLKDVADFGARLAGTSVDVLINNAGISRASWPGGDEQPEPLDLDPTAWDEVLRVNLVAPFMLTMTMRRNLADSARKLVIMMSSDLGSITNNTMGGSYAYRASKAGLNMVTKGLALDLAGDGIAVISMAPGWVRTELGGPSAHWSVEESVANQLKVITGLTSADSGKFINLLGEPVAW